MNGTEKRQINKAANWLSAHREGKKNGQSVEQHAKPSENKETQG